VGFLGIAAVLALPWMILEMHWTGNPVYPFLTSLFPGNGASATSTYAAQIGTRMSLRDFLALPITLITQTQRFYPEGPMGMLGAVPLLMLPWLYAWHPCFSPSQRRQMIAFFGCVVVGAVLVMLTSSRVRYVIPLFPFASILASANALALWDYVRTRTRPGQKPVLLAAALAVGLIYFGSTRLGLTVRSWDIPDRYPYQAALGIEDPDTYLSNALPVYDALQFLNRQGDGTGAVLSINNEVHFYSSLKMYGTATSTAAMNILTEAKPESIAQDFVKTGIGFILINYSSNEAATDQTPFIQSGFIDRYARLEFSRNNVYVYRFFQDGVPSGAAPENLISNPGFEAHGGTTGGAKDWTAYGEPKVAAADPQAEGSLNSAEVTEKDFLYTTVPIEPNQLYTLGEWIKADTESQAARLQIVWLDLDQKPLGTSIEVDPVTGGWLFYKMSVTSPDSAASARIYVTAHDNSQVWVEGVCFAAGDRCQVNH
jgi:hypothetical protein